MEKERCLNIEHRIMSCFHCLNLRMFESELVEVFDDEIISIVLKHLAQLECYKFLEKQPIYIYIYIYILYISFTYKM